jgi:hypothetical protein
MKTRTTVLIGLAVSLSFALRAETSLAGKWEFSPTKSKNAGMMTQMKITATIKQTRDELVVETASIFNGQAQSSEIRLDLAGKIVVNETPMGGKADTVTHWDGDRLVTVWTSPGAVAGTKTVRTETRWLSSDGRVLSVESVRGEAPAMLMVYDKK